MIANLPKLYLADILKEANQAGFAQQGGNMAANSMARTQPTITQNVQVPQQPAMQMPQLAPMAQPRINLQPQPFKPSLI